MKRLLATLFVCMVAMSSCRRSSPTVVLDSWWTRDFAKETCAQANEWRKANSDAIRTVGCEAIVECKEMTAISASCAVDPSAGVIEFESEIATAFAIDTRCKGLTFVRFNGPDDADTATSQAMAAPHWLLTLNFTPGRQSQEWQMLRSPDNGGYTKGAGTPADIARVVCSVANGRGASLAN